MTHPSITDQKQSGWVWQGDASERHQTKALRPAQHRELVDRERYEWDQSIRRICEVLSVDRSTYHYQSKRADQAGLKKRIKEICETRVRFGYQRVWVLMRREGWKVNQKRVYWLYRELGMPLRNKAPKRCVKAKLRSDRSIAVRPQEIWVIDFVHDQLATGRKLRTLTVVDTYSRYCPVIDPRFSYRDQNVVNS